ncbi:hypothetical protein H0H93_011295, partial [Arthromyces matolae]
MTWDTQRHATQPTIVHPELEHARKHVLLTYKEVSLSASEICNYKTAVRVLSDTTESEAARYLRLPGYAHRDISAENCLSDGKMGKVSNLEYARPYTESVGHDPRTGTPAFMAAEYLRGSYYLTARRFDSGALSMSDVVAQEMAKPQASGPFIKDPHRTRFNFYHDLESIFWIYVWFLHYKLPKKLMQSNPNLSSLNDSAQSLFLNVIAENRERSNLIFERDGAPALLDILTPIYTPEFRDLVRSVHVRAALALAYSSLEEADPVQGLWAKDDFKFNIYTVMKEVFDAMAAAMKVEADYEAEVLFFDLKREAST